MTTARCTPTLHKPKLTWPLLLAAHCKPATATQPPERSRPVAVGPRTARPSHFEQPQITAADLPAPSAGPLTPAECFCYGLAPCMPAPPSLWHVSRRVLSERCQPPWVAGWRARAEQRARAGLSCLLGPMIHARPPGRQSHGHCLSAMQLGQGLGACLASRSRAPLCRSSLVTSRAQPSSDRPRATGAHATLLSAP